MSRGRASGDRTHGTENFDTETLLRPAAWGHPATGGRDGAGREGKGEGRGSLSLGRQIVNFCEKERRETASMVHVVPGGGNLYASWLQVWGETRTEGLEPSSLGKQYSKKSGVSWGSRSITTTTTREVCRLAFISSTTAEPSSSASASGSISPSYPSKTEADGTRTKQIPRTSKHDLSF